MTGQPGSRVRTYLGWQQEKVAFLFGLSGQRALALAAAVLAAIWPLAAARPADGAVCWPAAAFLAAAALARIGGRTAGEWAAAAASYYLGAARDQHKFAAAAFTPPAAGRRPDADGPARHPRPAAHPGSRWRRRAADRRSSIIRWTAPLPPWRRSATRASAWPTRPAGTSG